MGIVLDFTMQGRIWQPLPRKPCCRVKWFPQSHGKVRPLEGLGGCGLGSHAEKIMRASGEVALCWLEKISLLGSWFCWQNKCVCKEWDTSQVGQKLENISLWEQTGILAVKVDWWPCYMRTVPGEILVLPPRGDGSLILCCGWGPQNPVRFTL